MGTELTREWVEANGFKGPEIGMFHRKLSEGPDDSEVSLMIGTTPWNGFGVMLYMGGYGVLTNATTQEDVKELIRLLDGGRMDHPYIEETDDELFDDGDE